ncbi:MAG: 7-cyano-7-deazaguanine synthase [Nanoarchaeota archaeon]|nr:7-cyano-7-deazaguanine synthase [Nanoarchaeota archaeon]
MNKKYIVLFSNGLDSRLVVKIMQKKKYEIVALFFKLPFSKDVENEVKKFVKENKVKLKLFDCTKGKLLKEYLKIIKKAEHGIGTGINPCIDCKIFMLKKAREFADDKGVELVATGEVFGQRPMSQTKKAMEIIEEKSGLKGRIVRPLSEVGALGRRRGKQIVLAKKFKLEYPHPAGGCLLCERELKKRLGYLLDRGLNSDEIRLVNVGRHFLIDNVWVVLGRNKEENKIIESVSTARCTRKALNEGASAIVPDYIGPSALILDKCDEKLFGIVNDLIKAYSKKGSLKYRKKFDGWKL